MPNEREKTDSKMLLSMIIFQFEKTVFSTYIFWQSIQHQSCFCRFWVMNEKKNVHWHQITAQHSIHSTIHSYNNIELSRIKMKWRRRKIN